MQDYRIFPFLSPPTLSTGLQPETQMTTIELKGTGSIYEGVPRETQTQQERRNRTFETADANLTTTLIE